MESVMMEGEMVRADDPRTLADPHPQEEQCPRRGPVLTHISTGVRGFERCVYCGVPLLPRRPLGGLG